MVYRVSIASKANICGLESEKGVFFILDGLFNNFLDSLSSGFFCFSIVDPSDVHVSVAIGKFLEVIPRSCVLC